MEIIELAIPLLVFFLMFIIGASLEKSHVINIKKQSNKVLILTLGQILLLPLCAWIVIQIMQPPPAVAAGMLLVSLCPGGAVSNIYSFLAKANVALSVTLTACNGLVAVFILPLAVISLFPALLSVDLGVKTLMFKQAIQLVFLLLFPVVLGMALRHYKPVMIQKVMPTLEKLGGLGLFVLLVTILTRFQDNIEEQLSSLVLLALVFTLTSLCIGYTLGQILKLTSADKSAVIIEFPVRNLALTALIAINLFHNSDYLLFAAVFFVIQTPIMLGITGWYRAKRTAKIIGNTCE
jgi:BASS family bile acid:Na+ symporter